MIRRPAVLGFSLLLALCFSLSTFSVQAANNIPPQPDPGLENSIRNADLIAEVEILSGGPFKATALVKKVWRSTVTPPFGIIDFPNNQAISLTAFNSTNGDTAHGGLTTGAQYVLFLSSTHEPLVFAPLSPTAPRLLIQGDKISVPVGDPPTPVSVRKDIWDEALRLLIAQPDQSREPVLAWLRKTASLPDVESRYLAVSLAGIFKQPGCEDLLSEAAKASLLRLRLTVIGTFKKLNTPDARMALRSLLKDDKESVARAAALALADLNDYGALEDLLTWALRAHKEMLTLPAGDTRRVKVLDALNRLLLMAEDGGPLLDPEKPTPLLLDLAKSPETTISTGALYVLGGMIRMEQMPALQELAENPAFSNRRAALFALFRATLVPPKETGEQSSLWKKALDPNGGEEWRKGQVGAAANALFRTKDDQDRQYYRAILRVAPAEQALPMLARFWMESADPAKYTADEPMIPVSDFALWRSPLALPFLVERLGSESERDRTDALLALASIFKRFPRLGVPFAPLARALLNDPAERVRNAAARFAATLNDKQAIPPIVHAIDPEGDLSLNASASLFELSSRTLGFGGYEALPDIQEAFRRILGWRVSAGGKALATRTLTASDFPLSPSERESVTNLFTAPNIRTRNTAFSMLANDSVEANQEFWQKKMTGNALDQCIWATAATMGAPEALTKSVLALPGGSFWTDPMERPLILLNLGTLPNAAGMKKLAQWATERVQSSKEDTQNTPAGLKRLTMLALGLNSNHPESLAVLQMQVNAGAKLDATKEEPGTPLNLDRFLFYPALLACAAREDSTPALLSALETPSPFAREFLLRALALRADAPITPAILSALSKLDVYQTASVARIWSSKVTPELSKKVLNLLKASESSARLTASIWMHDHIELFRTEEARTELILVLEDPNSGVRAYAAKTLGLLKERRAVPRLATLTTDYTNEVSASAAQALIEIGDPDGVLQAAQAATRQTRLDSRWMKAYGAGTGVTGLDFLFKLVRADNWIDRRNGISGLSASGEARALERLFLLYRDPESILRDHAADALQDWIRINRDPESRKSFYGEIDRELAATEPETRVRVVSLLGEILDSDAAQRVIKALESPDPAVRSAAQSALYCLVGQLEPEKAAAKLNTADAIQILKQASSR